MVKLGKTLMAAAILIPMVSAGLPRDFYSEREAIIEKENQVRKLIYFSSNLIFFVLIINLGIFGRR